LTLLNAVSLLAVYPLPQLTAYIAPCGTIDGVTLPTDAVNALLTAVTVVEVVHEATVHREDGEEGGRAVLVVSV
jgi:hypothetical protein